MANSHTGKLGKHHVVPEVEEVEQQTQQDDDTQHEHVLRSPLYLLGLDGYLVA